MENKISLHSGDTGDILNKPRVRTETDAAYEKCWIPWREVQLQENPRQVVLIFLWIIFSETGGTEMEQHVLARLRKHFHVGSEDWNDVTFTGERIRWTTDPQSGSCIEVGPQKRPPMKWRRSQQNETRKDDLHCTPAMHTRYRSLLGQINWLQSRTQFQCCHKCSRCASVAAPPTIGDVKALNKLARQLQSQPVTLQFWPLTGPLRIVGFPDASYRNNENGSSQRGMTVFLAESRERSSKDGTSYGSLID